MNSFTTICQTTSNTEYSLVKTSKLAIGAKLIELGKIDKQAVQLLNQKVDSLNQRIGFLLAAVAEFKSKDSIDKKIGANYELEIINLKGQVEIASTAMVKQNKLYRRQKRKTVFVAIAGPVITAAVFIYLKK